MRRCEQAYGGGRLFVAAARSRRFLVDESRRLEGEEAPLRAAPTELCQMK